MGLINQIGYFRGAIIDGGLGQSSGGLPQEEWILRATEVYDEDGQEYIPVDGEHDEITAWLILMNHNRKENRNAQQVKKITDWDGASYPELMEMDLADVPLSWQVKEKTGDYEGLEVSWVDIFDATPGRTVSRITKEEAQALQARYASVLAVTKAPAKAVSAKGKGKTKATARVVGEKLTKGTGRPKAPKPTAPKAATAPVGKCSADDAYNECFSLKRDDVTEDQLNELWITELAKVNADEAKITEEEFFQIKETILKHVSKV
jgi:hypothetical protein